MAFYRLNEKHNGVEIVFNEKPNADTLEALKMGGFRWHRGGGYWYAVQSAERLELAEKVTRTTEGTPEAEKPEEYYTILTDGYMGATETTGSVYANGGRYYGSDLSKAIREALKKCKIGGCSVRCKTFSGGQEITVTMKINRDDVVPFEDFYEALKHDYSDYWYVDEDGKQIHKDAMPWSDYDKAQRIIKNTLKVRYESVIKDMGGQYSGYHYHKDGGILTKAAADKAVAIQRILNAFNHDDSNGMVDYFDRHFYEDIYIKFAA